MGLNRVLFPFFLLPSAVSAQAPLATLPPGTQLPITLPQHLPMKVGEPIRAELLYPVYADNMLILPAKTVVLGSVVSLAADHKRRVSARFRGDFTAFYKPVVQFNSLLLAGGASVPMITATATDGAPIYRLVAPPPRNGGLIAREFGDLKQFAKDRLAVITGPDKGDRALQFFYSQLPYHPQRIAKATSWTVETSAPVDLTPPVSSAPAALAPVVAQTAPEERPTWILQAYLSTPLSSETSKPGEPIQATVAEPIRNPDGSIAVPQGAILTGSITHTRPARKFSRAGELRFSFKQITFPGQEPQSIRASLKGADTSSAAQLAMDSEGNVQPKPQDKLIVPLILLALAARPLDQDHGLHHDQFGKDAAGSNSVGLLGFILGTAAQRPNLAAGLGYYGAAVSIYHRIFAKGEPVNFPRDTRVVIQTTATRSAALKPTQ